MLHIHSATEEVVLKQLICHIDKKTGKPDKEKGRPRFVKQVRDLCVACPGLTLQAVHLLACEPSSHMS